MCCRIYFPFLPVDLNMFLIVDSKNMFRRKTPFLLHCHLKMNWRIRCKSWLLYFASTSITPKYLSSFLCVSFLHAWYNTGCLAQWFLIRLSSHFRYFSLYTESHAFHLWSGKHIVQETWSEGGCPFSLFLCSQTGMASIFMFPLIDNMHI